MNGDASAVAKGAPVSVWLSVVTNGAQADFVWDASTKEAISSGDVVARNVTADEVPWVADRIAAARALAAMAEKRPQTIVLKPNDALHKEKEQLDRGGYGSFRQASHYFQSGREWHGPIPVSLKDDKPLIAEDKWSLPLR